APAEWGIEDTREMDLSELLKKAPRESLQKVHAIRGTKLVIMLVAAVITPPDLMTLILVTIPLYLLYEVSIRVVKIVEE
ncbi:MAG: hypothetical protein J6Z41_08965, partial [Prevotella sp.]|nr:hypothetical protein [Prevotella sp.]